MATKSCPECNQQVLGIEPKTLCMLGTHSTPELYPPSNSIILKSRNFLVLALEVLSFGNSLSPGQIGKVPVACKSCPCGYVFINRKYLKMKQSEKSAPFTGHSAAMASRNINSVFGEGSVSERTIRWWFEKFRSGDLSLKNEPRGRPRSVLNEDQLRAMVEANPKTAIRGLAADLGVSATTISRHLAAIGKVKKLDKWVGTTPVDGQS
ncbi:histone-lysine N-methyltransferase SETMAR isoform X1 [Camelus dromedarius]|uniref:histone-lysine N-methyltransferase SETMAR isoform X1 n=1 Tax=Camelus dromedarius TaxID=9838 RepID=UPI00311A42E8